MRSTKEILLASQEFATEQPWQSWWHFLSTLGLFACLATIAGRDFSWALRLPCSVLAGLTIVRLFIVYHDQQHGTIFRGSRIARLLMWALGLLCLSPSSVWKRSHDHHHRNNARELDPNIGSFRLMTVADYREASPLQRWLYRCSRHPLTLALGYLTVFAGNMCLAPFLGNPRRHFDGLLALLCHFGFAWLVFRDWDGMLLGWIVPFMIGTGFGAYLFFAQHNFPGMRLRSGEKWDYVFSALHSSSYLDTGPVLRWFTGNIGYHHVHHLNAKIPFYRLPAAMAAIEELQSPKRTSLALRDIAACLRLKLWDADAQELVSWPDLTPADPTGG